MRFQQVCRSAGTDCKAWAAPGLDAWRLGRQLARVAAQQAVIGFAEQDLDADRGSDAGAAAIGWQRTVRPEQFNAELEEEPVAPGRASVRHADPVQVRLGAVGFA